MQRPVKTLSQLPLPFFPFIGIFFLIIYLHYGISY
jgi:hypothetical protein